MLIALIAALALTVAGTLGSASDEKNTAIPADSNAPGEVLRVAPPPACPDARIVTASQIRELGRAPNVRNEHGREYSMFEPRLLADAGGVRLLWTPQAQEPLHLKGNRVLTRLWTDGRWSDASVVVEGGDSARSQPDGVSVGSGRWAAAWFEADPNGGGLLGRWVASQCSGDQCSKPGRVTDNEYDGWYPFKPGFLVDVDGLVHRFWMGGRETHRVLSLYDPVREFSKVYRKLLGAPREEPAEQVTARGRYVVTQFTPVRSRSPGPLEIVFFKKYDDDPYMMPERSADLYLTSRLEGRWSTPKPLLVAAKGYRREVIEYPLAYRSSSEELYIVFQQGYDLRVLRRDARKGRVVVTIAGGVSPYNDMWPPLRADIGPDGTLSIVYHGLVERFGKMGLWTSYESENQPYYLIRTDGKRCLAAVEVTSSSTKDSLFDVAVDEQGRTHVVWVENENGVGVLKHRWFLPMDSRP